MADMAAGNIAPTPEGADTIFSRRKSDEAEARAAVARPAAGRRRPAPDPQGQLHRERAHT